jgi:isocitrate dehydrogenase (NAD+)
MDLGNYATRIESAVLKTIRDGQHITGDLGGKASTTEFTSAICSLLKS